MCADGYRVGTRSGQIQYVADAGALAADSVVAEFITIGQVVDAVLLSMSLLGITVYAVSAVVAFIPMGASASAKLVKAGNKIMKIRNKFGNSAVKGLDQAQKALPALCAVRAAQVVHANAQASGQDYVGIAITCPMTGVKLGTKKKNKERSEAKKDEKEQTDTIKSEEKTVRKKSKEADRLEKQAELAKEDAWVADCGSKGENMQKRARKLAGLTGAQNPSRKSVDTWTFSVALQRAKTYYAARTSQEPGAYSSGSPEDVGKSVARKKFYEYAYATVSQGTIAYSRSGAELPDFKYLAHGKDEIIKTHLYTDPVYPISQKDGKCTLHAYTGCPAYAKESPAGTGPVAGIDAGSYARCDTCKFSASSLWRVSSLTSTQETGFELQYYRMVEASKRYKEAEEGLDSLQTELTKSATTIKESIKNALAAIKGWRYDPQPPGRFGCICIVVAPERKHATLPFLGKASTTPARIAISGATLAPDDADDQGSVISDMAEGLVPGEGFGSGLLRAPFRAWGVMLQAYTAGNNAIEGGFDAVFGLVPVVGNELSGWAKNTFRSTMQEANLQPADLTTYKPVLVNTSQIAERDGGTAAKVLGGLKKGSEVYSAVELKDLEALVDTLGIFPDLGSDLKNGELIIATLSFDILGKNIANKPITIPVPDNVSELYETAVSSVKSLLEVE